MRCPKCGSSNKITLKKKQYCADCGQLLPQATPHSHHKSAPKHKAHHATKTTKSHLLDLTHASKKQPAQTQQAPSRNHTAAQTIHGVRRTETIRRSAKLKTQPTHVTRPAVKQASQVTQRKHRAQAVTKSPQISKFPADLKQPVAQPPKQQREPTPEPVTLSPHQTYMVNKKVAQANRQAAIAMHHSRTHQTQASNATTKPVPKTHKKTRNPFKGLANFFKARPRLAMSSAVAASVLIIAGYITYLNYPSLNLRVAASRAGVAAQMPRYTPSGYSFEGPVDYSPGQITIKFGSNSDAGFITVSQRETNWDSASLLENYVLQKSKNYISFQENGLTIFMYNGNNAAWVNRGIFYTIEGNNYLNSEQVVKMATSL